MPFPTKDELISKIDDINRMVNYVWTDEELNEKLRRVREMHAKYGPFQREAVQKQLELARARGDEEAVARLQERLDSLEVPRLAFRTGSLFPQMKTSTTATTTTTFFLLFLLLPPGYRTEGSSTPRRGRPSRHSHS